MDPAKSTEFSRVYPNAVALDVCTEVTAPITTATNDATRLKIDSSNASLFPGCHVRIFTTTVTDLLLLLLLKRTGGKEKRKK